MSTKQRAKAQPGSATGKWGDLGPRVLSGIAMIAVGAFALWMGGHVFAALGVLLVGLMTWELVSMIRPGHRNAGVQEGLVAAFALAVSLYVPGGIAAIILGILLIVLVGRTGKLPLLTAAYGAGIFLGAYGLVALRNDGGMDLAVWLIAVVVITDIAGYFAGRIIGGPKFWPRVSPKKTWSGTVAGWIAAFAITYWLYTSFFYPEWVLWAAIPLSFASQLGDAAESAIKRKTGVKDSSALIPGHGGVMDRFDGMIGASLVLTIGTVLATLV